MRRLALVAAGSAFLLAGCGAGQTVSPVAKTVKGPLPTTKTAPGDPVKGKTLFTANGCSACHTFTPAGSKASIGPDLDGLAADAQKAAQGTVEEYTKASIVDPNAYVAPGFAKGVMPSFGQLSGQQVADLVAFLTKTP